MEFTLKITGEEVNTIWIALGKLPYENVSKLMVKLQKQVNEQNTPVTEIQEEIKEEIAE